MDLAYTVVATEADINLVIAATGDADAQANMATAMTRAANAAGVDAPAVQSMTADTSASNFATPVPSPGSPTTPAPPSPPTANDDSGALGQVFPLLGLITAFG